MIRHLAACLILIGLITPAAALDQDALKKACHDDYEAFCKGVMPGGGRIIACLHTHDDKLSAQCKTALSAQ
ncbi:MAG: cysteine rich repeat-containing protein [Methylovirgula sp.]